MSIIKKKSTALKSTKVKKVIPPKWDLQLYIVGNTIKSSAALSRLKSICEEHLLGQYQIEVIDLLEQPQLAKSAQILAIPTLVRNFPHPLKKIIGDLSNVEKVIMSLEIKTLGKI